MAIQKSGAVAGSARSPNFPVFPGTSSDDATWLAHGVTRHGGTITIMPWVVSTIWGQHVYGNLFLSLQFRSLFFMAATRWNNMKSSARQRIMARRKVANYGKTACAHLCNDPGVNIGTPVGRRWKNAIGNGSRAAVIFKKFIWPPRGTLCCIPLGVGNDL